MKRKMLLLTLALPVFMFQNAQAQTSSRLIAEAHWLSTGVSFTPHDSADYKYSHGRGGSMDVSPNSIDAVNYFNNSPMLYDNSTTWNFLGDTAYSPNLYYFQTFDGYNNILTNTTQNPDGSPNSNTLYTYNASNMLVKAIMQTWNTGTGSWQSQTQHTYTYNSAGKLYIDSTQTYVPLTSSWTMSALKTYFYDGSTNMNMINETDQTWTLGSPSYTNQLTRTFTSMNQLLTTTWNNWNGTGWVPAARYVHAYDGSGNPISIEYDTYNTTTVAFVQTILYTFSSFTGSHLPQIGYLQTWNTLSNMWDNYRMYTYSYNTYNQMTSSTGKRWNASSSSYQFAANDPMDNYYYETYAPTFVPNVTNNGEVNIYPVPAQNMLHVDLSWTAAQSATITIMDVTGNVVKQWNAPTGTQYNSAVSVNDLASGMYIVKVAGEKAQIVKQIVVAH